MSTMDTQALHDVLQNYSHIAVVGCSANPARPSYAVAQYLQAHGYQIIPVNPRYVGQNILGRPVYATLTEAKAAGETIEIVDVFRRAEDTPLIASEAGRVGAKVLWLQLGISNEQTRQLAETAGLIYVEDHCLKIEHSLLFHA